MKSIYQAIIICCITLLNCITSCSTKKNDVDTKSTNIKQEKKLQYIQKNPFAFFPDLDSLPIYSGDRIFYATDKYIDDRLNISAILFQTNDFGGSGWEMQMIAFTFLNADTVFIPILDNFLLFKKIELRRCLIDESLNQFFKTLDRIEEINSPINEIQFAVFDIIFNKLLDWRNLGDYLYVGGVKCLTDNKFFLKEDNKSRNIKDYNYAINKIRAYSDNNALVGVYESDNVIYILKSNADERIFVEMYNKNNFSVLLI